MRCTTPEPSRPPPLLGRMTAGRREAALRRRTGGRTVKVICPICLGRVQQDDSAARAVMERRIDAWLTSPDRIARVRASWVRIKKGIRWE